MFKFFPNEKRQNKERREKRGGSLECKVRKAEGLDIGRETLEQSGPVNMEKLFPGRRVRLTELHWVIYVFAHFLINVGKQLT